MARVMLEAGFARLCPIAYDIPANRDLIAEGRGFLIPKGDVERVVSILRTLAADRHLLAEKAEAYQSHVVRHFNMETFARRMDDILMEAVVQTCLREEQ